MSHKGVINISRGNDRPHGDGPIRKLFGYIQNIRHNAERIGTGHGAAAAEPCYHLVKN